MVTNDSSKSSLDLSRIEVLERARSRRQWTDELVVDCASAPAAFKAELPACAACPAPCEDNEVCATSVAKSEQLFEPMSRRQVYHLIESAMKRLRTRGEAEYRTTESERPNTFVALVDDRPVEREGEDVPARDAPSSDCDERDTQSHK